MAKTNDRLAWRATIGIKYLGVAALLAGCGSIAEVDVSRYQPECARTCTTTYSSCITGPLVSGMQLERCKQALDLCLKTCPLK